MMEYNDMSVYDLFNKYFTVYGGRPDLNLLPIIIYYSPRPNKIVQYTSDMLPYSIHINSENSGSTLITPSDSSQLLVMSYDDPDTQHTIMSDKPCLGRAEIGYYSRFHDGKIFYKNGGSIDTCVQLTIGFIALMDPSKLFHN